MTMYQLKKSGMETAETGTPTHKLNTIDSLHTEGDNTADFSVWPDSNNIVAAQSLTLANAHDILHSPFHSIFHSTLFGVPSFTCCAIMCYVS